MCAAVLEKGGLRRSLRRAGVTPETLIGFADEMRVGLRGMVRRVWGVRGLKVVQRLQSTCTSISTCSWSVHYAWGKLEWTWMDSMSSAMVFRAVLSVKLDTVLRALVWDGAGSHRSELVRSVEGVRTILQPAYSPELNPAERVFEEVRRWVEGRVYGSLEEKVDAVNEYLSRLESDAERVKSLVSWEWIRRSVQGLSEDYAASSS